MQRYMERVWELMNDEEVKHFVPLYDEATPKGVSYEQIRDISGRLYAYLKARNIGKEDFVMIKLPRGVQPVIAMIGVWRAGAAFVIAEEIMAPERVDYIYKDCGCKMAITSEVWEEVLRCEPLSGYEETDPHDAAYAVYTSGTTGNPKGVLHEQGNVDICVLSSYYEGKGMFSPGDRGIHVIPLNFVASTMVLPTLLYLGNVPIRIISFSTLKNPLAFVKYLLVNRITILLITPTYAQKLAGKTGPFLKKVCVGSEPANHFHLKGLINYNMYSQSESGFIVSMFSIDKEYDVCPIGKPQFDLKYRIIDEEGNDVPAGEIGEFIFENPYARGYINLLEETQKVFRDGYYYSGDLAQMLPDGNIAIRGRKSDMIKINGNRIEPAEVEAVIRSELNIGWCAVRGFTDDKTSFICAYYKDDITFDPAELRTRLQKKLPYYMIPAHFVQITNIPEKANGKMDRNALPKPEIKDITRTYKEPTNEVEAALCLAMQNVLNMDRIGIDDDFYEMGGDSLGSMELLIESGLPGLDASCIFRGRTAAQIAKLYMEQIQNRDQDGDEALNDLAKREEHKLMPEQLDFFNYQSYMPNSTMYNLFKMIRFDKNGVDLERMAKAIEMAIKNHPALRTILQYNENGELIQKYDSKMPAVIRPEKISEDELNKIKDTLVAPFKIINSPLFRCRLFETENAAYLFFDVHHIVFDGTSVNIFMNSVINAYLGAPLETDYYYLVLTRRKQMELTDFYEESRQYHVNMYGNEKWTTYPKFDRKPQENKLGSLSCNETISPVHISSVEKKFMVSRNEFFIAATLLAIAISTNKNDVQVSWVYNGRDDLASTSSVGLLYRELVAALRLCNKTNLRDIFAEIHKQVRNGIKYSCYPYMAMKPQNEDGDTTCVIYQRDIHKIGDFVGINVNPVEIAHNNAAAPSVLDFQILDDVEGLQYVFDYAASRYDEETMTTFQNLFKQVVATIVNNANTDGYTFAQLKKDVCGKKGLLQRIKGIFAKKN